MDQLFYQRSIFRRRRLTHKRVSVISTTWCKVNSDYLCFFGGETKTFLLILSERFLYLNYSKLIQFQLKQFPSNFHPANGAISLSHLLFAFSPPRREREKWKFHFTDKRLDALKFVDIVFRLRDSSLLTSRDDSCFNSSELRLTPKMSKIISGESRACNVSIPVSDSFVAPTIFMQNCHLRGLVLLQNKSAASSGVKYLILVFSNSRKQLSDKNFQF